MTCLLTQVTALDGGSHGDAVLIMDRDVDQNSALDFSKVKAVLRRKKTSEAITWDFYVTTCIGGDVMGMGGSAGDINDVVRAAEFQFGQSLKDRICVSVNYTVPGFPEFLVPVPPRNPDHA